MCTFYTAIIISTRANLHISVLLFGHVHFRFSYSFVLFASTSLAICIQGTNIHTTNERTHSRHFRSKAPSAVDVVAVVVQAHNSINGNTTRAKRAREHIAHEAFVCPPMLLCSRFFFRRFLFASPFRRQHARQRLFPSSSSSSWLFCQRQHASNIISHVVRCVASTMCAYVATTHRLHTFVLC